MEFKSRKSAYEGFGAGVFAQPGLQLRVAGVGKLHDAVANDTRNNAAEGGKGQEERLRIPCPPH